MIRLKVNRLNENILTNPLCLINHIDIYPLTDESGVILTAFLGFPRFIDELSISFVPQSELKIKHNTAMIQNKKTSYFDLIIP